MTRSTHPIRHALDILGYCTCRVKCEDEVGRTSVGTSFFMRIGSWDPTKPSLPILITNRHVVEGATKGTLYLSAVDEEQNPGEEKLLELQVSDFQNMIVYHPDDDVDLAAIMIGEQINKLGDRGLAVAIVFLTPDLIVGQDDYEEIDQIEDVYVVGYPNGIWDSRLNLPVVRKGITATPVTHYFKGAAQFLIDCAIFPGSSGSPVVVVRYNQKTESNIVRLVGVNSAVFQHRVDGSVDVIPIPQSYTATIDATIPNHLGVAVSAWEIHNILMEACETLDYPYACDVAT